MLRIASVFGRAFDLSKPSSISETRWLRVAAALARRGHAVDLIIPPGSAGRPAIDRGVALRTVALESARWQDYDVIKVAYQKGFQILMESGAEGHPFILCRLGGVVDARDREDVSFTGTERRRLFEIQRTIAKGARGIAVSTKSEALLWRDLHGGRLTPLIVPTGVDAQLPAAGHNPYRAFPEKIVLHLGNLRGARRHYAAGGGEEETHVSQEALNHAWQHRLNRIGRRLRARGLRLCCVGPGLRDELDPDAVTDLGVVAHEETWNLQRHADAGLVLAHGETQLHECSKLYGYLRSGLPPVSESPIPNNDLIEETGIGRVAPYDDDEQIADQLCAETERSPQSRRRAMEIMAERYSWDQRVGYYDAYIRAELRRDRKRAALARISEPITQKG